MQRGKLPCAGCLRESFLFIGHGVRESAEAFLWEKQTYGKLGLTLTKPRGGWEQMGKLPQGYFVFGISAFCIRSRSVRFSESFLGSRYWGNRNGEFQGLFYYCHCCLIQCFGGGDIIVRKVCWNDFSKKIEYLFENICRK